ncbi:hypothetical protein U876_24155 [Aeromonas hydrophila NJ-35]|uniref:hypothetical protein n=1 Tax=Aeromonas TaxID=642 RepID=UPI000640B7E8|nr:MULTISPECIES: hypothetical protein [Aeromonas]AKJ36928.1 hypothetical protein U876_24155 [Aeromonas hydrophila NJ-35]QGW99189.1 hypothetical protein FGM04_21910 [Aeromonas veronii]HDK8695714.1 hypothetical protein [Aeromonas hydrophila]
MMTLTTVAKKTSRNSALVFWRVGTKRKGILDVHTDFEHEESDLIAELIAIRYLALDKQVFCREPGGGTGYKLVVSKGAIKKLALGKSSKAFATRFASFLTGRMQGAMIEVAQSMDYMDEPSEGNVEILDVDKQAFTQTYDEIDTPAIGPVLVTQHALNQYQARITSGDPKKPWASLVGRLQHPELQLQPFDDKVARHKAVKYGRVDNVEVWGHRDSKFKYLMVINDDNNKRVLVTVFERKE